MLFYLLLAIITAILTELSIYHKDIVIRKLITILSIGIPSFFYAVRYNTGTDYFSYVLNFKLMKSGHHTRMEVGYVLLNKIVAKLNGEVELLFFIVALIFFTMIRLSLIRNKDLLSPGYGMLVFMLSYYQMSFNLVRQTLAMSILLFSFEYIVKQKKLKWIICVIVAALFHLSALIFIPAFFINLVIIKDKYLAKSIIKIVLVFTLVILNIDYVMKISILQNYRSYLLTANSINKDLGFFVRSLPFIFIGVYLYITGGINVEDNRISLAYTLYIVSVALKFTVYIGGSYINRMALNYEIILVILVPMYLNKLRSRNNKFIEKMLLCYVVLHWWFVFVYSGSQETIPYQWIYY